MGHSSNTDGRFARTWNDVKRSTTRWNFTEEMRQLMTNEVNPQGEEVVDMDQLAELENSTVIESTEGDSSSEQPESESVVEEVEDDDDDDVDNDDEDNETEGTDVTESVPVSDSSSEG